MRELSRMTETPTLSETIQTVIDSVLCNVFTAFPGQIVSYDSALQTAEIQINLMRMYYDQPSVSFPVLPGVPVVFPRGGGTYIHFPLAPGDPVLLVFSSRSLDAWKTLGGEVDPNDSRKFDLSDAFAIPGGAPMTSPLAPQNPQAVEIANGQAVFQAMASGKFKLTNGANELIDVLDKITAQLQMLASTLASDTTNTLLGPMKLNGFADYQSISSAVSSLKSKLETLKG